MKRSPLSFTAPDSDYEVQAYEAGKAAKVAGQRPKFNSSHCNNYRVWFMYGFKHS